MIISEDRIIWVDYAKALGILLVVLGHFKMIDEDVNGFIYCFHMPLFFLISGYLTSDKSLSLSAPRFIISKIIKIIIPYYLFQLICGLYLIVRILYANNSTDIFQLCIGSLVGNPSQMFCVPGWFLWSLLWSNILIYIYIHSDKLMTIVFIILLSSSFFCPLPRIFALYTVPYSFVFFFIGFKFRNMISKFALNAINKRVFGICGSLILLLIVYLVYKRIGNLDIGRNYYTDYRIISLFTALIGIAGVILLSCTIMTLTKMHKYFKLTSSGTLLIMCLHIPLVQFIQLHIFETAIPLYLSIASSLLIVCVLTILYIPVSVKFPLLVGKKKIKLYNNPALKS